MKTLLPYGELLAMPVRYGRNNAHPRWEPIWHYDIIKLRKAVKDSLSSPYFNFVVRSIFDSYDLTLSDCRNISSLILMKSQYILWDLEWRKHLSRLVERHAGGPHAQLTVGELAGDTLNDKSEDQARAVLGDIKNAAKGLF